MHPFRRSMTALAVAALFVTGSPWAQTTGAQAVNTPAQALQASLEAVAARFGLKLQLEPGAAQGRAAPALEGTMDATSALRALLAGSGLEFRINGDALVVQGASAQTIEIKGQLLRSDAQRSAASVNVTTGAAIEKAGIRQLDEVYQRAAGVSTVSGREGFSLRGIGDSSIDGSGGGDLASLIVDGAALTNDTKRFGPSNLWDVEQVEVMRGPQSTNIGRSALAGAVVVRTRDPEMFFEAEGRAMLGTYSERQLSATLNLPLSEAGVALRLAADDARSDGYTTNPTLGIDDYDRTQDQTLRAKLLIEPKRAVPGLRVVASVQASNNRRSGYGETTDADAGEARINTSDYPSRRINEAVQFGLNVDYSLSKNWKLTSTTAYIDSELDSLRDSDQSAAPGGFVGRQNGRRNASQEFRLAYDGGSGTRGVFGVFAGRDRGDIGLVGGYILSPGVFGISDELTPFYPATLSFDIGGNDLEKYDNQAAYAEFEFALAPGWRLTSGLRYDKAKSGIDTTRTVTLLEALPDPTNPALTPDQAAEMAATNAFLQDFTSTAPFRTGSASYSALLPHLSLSRDWNPNLTTSITYKRGYRAGQVELLNFSDEINRVDPETLDNLELSLRSRFLGGRLTVNANAYFGRWKDQQIAVPASALSQDFRLANAGESRISGLELEIAGRPMSGLNLFGAFGYAKTEFKRFVSFDEDYAGNRFAYAPEVTASVGGDWRFGAGGGGGGGNWFLGGSANHVGKRFADAANTVPLKGYTLLNLRAGYEAASYSLHLMVRNATDEFVILDTFESDSGTPLIQTGAPRTVALEFRVRW